MFPLIATFFISRSIAITNYLNLFLVWYPIIFLFVLVRSILEYFDKQFYGDNLFITCIFLSVMYGIKLSLIFFIGLNLISYYNKLTNARVLYKFFISLPIILISSFLYSFSIMTASLWATIPYLILFSIGALFVKYKKRDLFLEIISNAALIPLYIKLYGVISLFF